MTKMIEKPKERGRHRNRVENEMIRRREKEFSYQQMWSGADKYFRHWEKANSRYDAWTSPRYYEDNNKLMSEIRNKREKEELLEKRREKLKRLLEEEQRSYEIELMVHKAKESQKTPQSKLDDIPTEVLKSINDGLKLEEEIKRKREAETKLYHQWRKNNPIVRQYESKYLSKDIKLSWLDQQIEKQMQKEKEEEESRRVLNEREKRLKKAEAEEELQKKQLQERKKQLKEALDQQIQELKRKQELAEDLKRKEVEDNRKKIELAEILEKQAVEEKNRAERECALYNIRQHKLKLKKKAAVIEENLIQENLLINKLMELQLENMISDEVKRSEMKQSLMEFADLVKQQHELEKQRQKHLEFLFDSEAKAIYEKQTNMWKQEELTRQNLLKNVLDTIKTQIEDNLQRNREKQRRILMEREEMTKQIEEYNNELKRLSEDEAKKKMNTRKMIDDDVKVKNAKKKLQENFKLKEINEELDRIKKEEERLQQEILKIQQRQGPYKPPRSRLFL